MSHVSDEELSHLKTKLGNTCDKYSQIHVPYKYEKVIKQLSNNHNICIMRQHKGRGVVIIDNSRNMGKGLELLQTNQFLKLKHNLIKSFEKKIWRTLRILKTIIYTAVLSVLSNRLILRKINGTTKLDKIPINDTVQNLPILPVVSNIGKASYHLIKYLAKMLLPMPYSEYTIRSTADLMNKVKKERIPKEYHYLPQCLLKKP